jgi:hypothetical protein
MCAGLEDGSEATSQPSQSQSQAEPGPSSMTNSGTGDWAKVSRYQDRTAAHRSISSLALLLSIFKSDSSALTDSLVAGLQAVFLESALFSPADKGMPVVVPVCLPVCLPGASVAEQVFP